jgi:hypothetical protein
MDYALAMSTIERLQAIDGYDEAAVVEVVTGLGYSTFVELDERPGQFDHNYAESGWHWKLRRARNSAPTFFDALNQVRSAWTVTITASFDYNSDDHGDFITSADDARADAVEWLASMGANPDAFEITVEEKSA